MNLKELKSAYDNACNEYLKVFCKKHGLYFDTSDWIGREAGGIAAIADYFVDMQTIKTDLDMDAPENEFVKWYDYCVELGCFGFESTPNFKSWLNGCPRKTDAEIEELRQARQRVNDAKRYPEELIEKEK